MNKDNNWLIERVEKARINFRLYKAIRTVGVREKIIKLLDEIEFHPEMEDRQ